MDDSKGKKDLRDRSEKSKRDTFVLERYIGPYAYEDPKAVALSSCEAEYVAMTTGASESVFLRNCIKFLTGKKCRIVLRCDSSSARAFCHRQGVGRVRHISCGLFWLQDLVQQGDLEVKPVSTWRNTADLSTKVQAKKRIQVLLNLMGFVDTHQD